MLWLLNCMACEACECAALIGSVVPCRLPPDLKTGRHRCFGFCEYFDPESAQSAIAQLHRAVLCGRHIVVTTLHNTGTYCLASLSSLPPKTICHGSKADNFLSPCPNCIKLGHFCSDLKCAAIFLQQRQHIHVIIDKHLATIHTPPCTLSVYDPCFARWRPITLLL